MSNEQLIEFMAKEINSTVESVRRIVASEPWQLAWATARFSKAQQRPRDERAA